MTSKRKKILIYLASAVILIFAIAWFAWIKLTTVKEPRLDTRNYKFELDSIRINLSQLKKQHATHAELKQAFVKAMYSKIFPYWYGTKWDFNGTTQLPQQGSIACGYFVTTTLQQAGVSINRVKMAQCASEEMIRSLVSKKNIFHLSGISLQEFKTKLKKLGNGLYIIGLDNHTGYIYVSDQEDYFIHASGWFPFKVVRQKLEESDVIGRSKYRVVGKISDDIFFLSNWINASK